MTEGTALVQGSGSRREVLNTRNPDAVSVIYTAPLSQKMKCCLTLQGILNPCSGMMCRADDVYNNSYVQIHENRVEVNMPSAFNFCLCLSPCREINDYVQVYYFDKRLTEHADVAKCCSPICCPLGINPVNGGYLPPAVTFPYVCCPTCCNICGEGAVLHGRMPWLCCHQFAQVPFLENAEEFVNQFNRAKDAYMNHTEIQPEQLKMGLDIRPRAAFNTQKRNEIRVLYRAPLSEKMRCFLLCQGILNPCNGYLCKTQEIMDNSYVQIHENRVEVNMPSPFQPCLWLPGCGQVNDYVRVYYFDKRIAKHADVSTFCSPICCPIGTNPVCGGYAPPAVTFIYPCCPTCFNMCGEGVTLHGELPILCCHQFAQIPFLADAQGFVDAFNKAQQQFLSGEAAPSNGQPQPMTMATPVQQ